MLTDVQTQRSAEIARSDLQRKSSNGWRTGFGNLFAKELGEWFGTARWLIHLILWPLLLAGMVGLTVFIMPIVEQLAVDAAEEMAPGEPVQLMGDPTIIGLATFFSLASIAGAIAVIILTQDEVVGEKQLGTAAWILSKPASRASFLLAKLAANLIAVLLFVLAVPAAISYIELSLAAGRLIDPAGYLLAQVPVVLVLLFYLTLTLMLGVLFSGRGPLLAVSFGLLFGGSMLAGMLPGLSLVLPTNLHELSAIIALGGPLPAEALLPLLSTALWSLIFTLVALWRFDRQEI